VTEDPDAFVERIEQDAVRVARTSIVLRGAVGRYRDGLACETGRTSDPRDAARWCWRFDGRQRVEVNTETRAPIPTAERLRRRIGETRTPPPADSAVLTTLRSADDCAKASDAAMTTMPSAI
jgi:hypothetical protein